MSPARIPPRSCAPFAYVTSFIGTSYRSCRTSATTRAMRAPLAMLPKGALDILKELARHLLRRPVVGVAAAAQSPDGRWLLIRRADTGTWALPGGTLEWGETLRNGVRRELL